MAISEKKGWPYYTVRYWMERHNIKRRPREEACYYGYWQKRNSGKAILRYKAERKLLRDDGKKVYYEKGYSARMGGNSLAVSISRMYDFMRKHGLSRRN